MDELTPEARHALATDLTIDITTTGRRSGDRRRIEIWFMNVDDRIFIAGSPGARDWLANLRAEPAFVFHLKESTQLDLAARAVEVTETATRRRVFEAETTRWYRSQASVDELVADAPLVEVFFDPN